MPLTPVFKSGAVQLRCNAVQRMQRYLRICCRPQSRVTSIGIGGVKEVLVSASMDSDRCLQDAGDAGSHSRSAQPQAQNLWIPTPTSGLRRSVTLRASVLHEILVLAVIF